MAGALRVLAARVSPAGVFARAFSASSVALKMKGPLSEETIAQYHRDGYVVCKDLLNAEERKEVIKWANEIQTWPETKGKWMQYFEPYQGRRMLCRTENFLDYHAPLKHFLTVKLNEAVGQLFGEESVLFKEKINFKLPGGAGFKPHQDAPAWTTFNQSRHMTAMVAADAADESNGCMWMVKGEHLKGTFPHGAGGALSNELCAEWKWHPLHVQAGDVAFFDSYTPHRSYDNTSGRSRRVYYITYNPKVDGDYRLAYYEDKRKAFPPDVEREPGKDYSAGARVYNVANPIPVQTM